MSKPGLSPHQIDLRCRLVWTVIDKLEEASAEEFRGPELISVLAALPFFGQVFRQMPSPEQLTPAQLSTVCVTISDWYKLYDVSDSAQVGGNKRVGSYIGERWATNAVGQRANGVGWTSEKKLKVRWPGVLYSDPTAWEHLPWATKARKRAGGRRRFRNARARRTPAAVSIPAFTAPAQVAPAPAVLPIRPILAFTHALRQYEESQVTVEAADVVLGMIESRMAETGLLGLMQSFIAVVSFKQPVA